MKSKWKVTSNYIAGIGTMFGVYRLLDINAVDHSGNREMVGDFTSDKESAHQVAMSLNEAEEATSCPNQN